MILVKISVIHRYVFPIQMTCYIFHAENQYINGRWTYQSWICICPLTVTYDLFKVHFPPKMNFYWFCLDAYAPLRWTMFKLHIGKKMIFQFLMKCSTTINKIFYNYLAIVCEIIVNIWEEGWYSFSLRNHNIYIP